MLKFLLSLFFLLSLCWLTHAATTDTCAESVPVHAFVGSGGVPHDVLVFNINWGSNERITVFGTLQQGFNYSFVFDTANVVCHDDYCSLIACVLNNTSIANFEANNVALRYTQQTDGAAMIGRVSAPQLVIDRVYVTNLSLYYDNDFLSLGISAAGALIGRLDKQSRVIMRRGMMVMDVNVRTAPYL